ncbi:DUF3465 domain-containing protein [Arenimonas sp. GDDSR-1]|uniref:DUF3465 domain-containing protein n=1 Tax=Arenimonas sp. GDDSR-1 TaxID=2950125 RepID=UPI00262BB508|nr:DUF3465 domain-containing protein [Arenimonas sp. GDDSR-1]
MKKWALIAVFGFAVFVLGRYSATESPQTSGPTRVTAQSAAPLPAATGADSIAEAYNRRLHDVPVQAEGRVVKVLPDDKQGSRHQRFLLDTGHGHTVLIAHNIDLAPRIDALAPGDRVAFKGEYVWNDKGGVVHWTHRDPDGRHPGGWLQHAGRTYQ